MRPLRFLAAVLALSFGLAVVPAPARADQHTTVTWKRIDVPAGDGSAALQKTLKKLLAQAARKAKFGKAKKVDLAIKVVELTSETKGDVHRVSCTIVGRVVGGASARSRISFGGPPAEKAKLEKQVLTMVTNAVVTRLAQIVKAQQAKQEKAEKAAAEG